jgi:hypothetical protein
MTECEVLIERLKLSSFSVDKEAAEYLEYQQKQIDRLVDDMLEKNKLLVECLNIMRSFDEAAEENDLIMRNSSHHKTLKQVIAKLESE